MWSRMLASQVALGLGRVTSVVWENWEKAANSWTHLGSTSQMDSVLIAAGDGDEDEGHGPPLQLRAPPVGTLASTHRPQTCLAHFRPRMRAHATITSPTRRRRNIIRAGSFAKNLLAQAHISVT